MRINFKRSHFFKDYYSICQHLYLKKFKRFKPIQIHFVQYWNEKPDILVNLPLKDLKKIYVKIIHTTPFVWRTLFTCGELPLMGKNVFKLNFFDNILKNFSKNWRHFLDFSALLDSIKTSNCNKKLKHRWFICKIQIPKLISYLKTPFHKWLQLNEPNFIKVQANR